MMESSAPASRAAITALTMLSKDTEDTRATLVREGGLRLLIGPVRGGDYETQALAAEALAMLSHHKQFHGDLYQSGCIPTILQLASSHDERVKTSAAKALSHLGTDENIYKMLKQNRQFTKILSIVRSSGPVDSFSAYISLLIK
eukprot:CAMPEP_0184311858 /NCGR_PEP_ID=MMETSP1049-20130417/45969_1 /TAXON_ID=77928 /ORGANISM="Proteomonas sulcata, Strain CCMP704" /LENGTH=143 /DNA_ID=CAMNT_0026627593 /DNA_START=92 /DNA_END=520 /DNA_ORIENTATION=-